LTYWFLKKKANLYVAIYPKKLYIICMDIQTLSVDISQASVQEQAAVQVQAMEIDTERRQAQAVDNLNSTVPETDPNLGQNIDLTA